MSSTFNIYCDESCHLEHDQQQVMVLGAVWCLHEKTREIAIRLREIKVRHGLKPDFEVKWTKVSPAQQAFYMEVIDYFFDDDDLHFRALVARKQGLRHADFNQDHDTWYYKMYFELLKALLSPGSKYNVYPDIKDTRSADRLSKLRQVLCNNMYDFQRDIILKIQPVRSHEVEQVQLADLIIGCVSYANRGSIGSSTKQALVNRMKIRSGYSLTRTTLLREEKVNIFRWDPKETGE